MPRKRIELFSPFAHCGRLDLEAEQLAAYYDRLIERAEEIVRTALVRRFPNIREKTLIATNGELITRTSERFRRFLRREKRLRLRFLGDLGKRIKVGPNE